MKLRRLQQFDCYEGGDMYSIFFDSRQKNIPTELQIADGEYWWNCYLVRFKLTQVHDPLTNQCDREMYHCTYKRY